MQRLATVLIAACALALTLVAIAPYQASAAWRRGWGYCGPGVGVYVGPDYGYYRHGYRYAYYGGARRSRAISKSLFQRRDGSSACLTAERHPMVMATATATIGPTTSPTPTPNYQPHCCSVSRPATIRVWDDYSCEYIFRTVYRDYQV